MMLFPWQKKWPTAPLQNPRNTVLTNQEDPMWRVRRDIQHPDVRILPRAQSNPIIPGANQVPSRSAAARAIHHGQEMGPNYGTSGNAAINTAMAVGGAEPSGGNVFANLLNRPESDTDFWDKLKEQLAEAGKDYDAADQPFKSLSPVSVPGARHQPAQMPSMLTTRGIPTGGSYNPYLGDPAKRKPRPR